MPPIIGILWRNFVRYLLLLDGAMLNSSTFYVHWDDDEGTTRFVTLQLIVLNETSSGELVPLDSILAVSVSLKRLGTCYHFVGKNIVGQRRMYLLHRSCPSCVIIMGHFAKHLVTLELRGIQTNVSFLSP